MDAKLGLYPTLQQLDPGRLRALHVVAGLSQSDGGPSYSVPRLCRALAAETHAEVTLLTVTREGEAAAESCEAGLLLHAFPQSYGRVPLLRSLRLSTGFDHALDASAAEAAVVHSHGLWLMPNVRAAQAASKARKPLVVSPRGMLSPEALSFSRTKKQLFWRLLQGSAVRGAACIHVTSHSELEEVRAFGLTNPIAVVANGIDVVQPCSAHMRPAGAERTVLSLGRIHPKKGLDRLVRAWAKVEAGHSDWRLRIAGPAEGGHDVELKALAASLGLSRVAVEGPVYGDDKLRAFEDADLFVLPTLNENFGITVAEALAAGVPVISTVGAPWRGLEVEGCGWWIEHGVDPLAAALAQAMDLPEKTLAEMGERGRAWVQRDFSWRSVAEDMTSLYRWLVRGGEAPSFVRLD